MSNASGTFTREERTCHMREYREWTGVCVRETNISSESILNLDAKFSFLISTL